MELLFADCLKLNLLELSVSIVEEGKLLWLEVLEDAVFYVGEVESAFVVYETLENAV